MGDPGLIPGLGRSPGEGNGNPLQYTCLENSMDGGAWWATVHGVMKSWTRQRLHDFTMPSWLALTFLLLSFNLIMQIFLPTIIFLFSKRWFLCFTVPFLIISCSCLMYVLSYNSEDIISFFLLLFPLIISIVSVSSGPFFFSVLFYFFFFPFLFGT